jgi:hypothetical protein
LVLPQFKELLPLVPVELKTRALNIVASVGNASEWCC